MDITRLCRAAVRVVRDEGWIALFVRAARFSRYLLGRTFRVERVYVCRFDLAGLESWPRPTVPRGVEVWVVASNDDAEVLARQGFEDVRELILRAERSLDAGCVALCIYHGRRLAHVGWVACSARAKERIDDVPYAVDFAHGEACTGGVFTFSEYRGRGLMPYSFRLRLEYLARTGRLASLAVVDRANTASLRAMSRVGPFVRRSVFHVKLPGVNYVRDDGPVEQVLQSLNERVEAADALAGHASTIDRT